MKKIVLILFAVFYIALMISIGYAILQVTGYFGLSSFIRILIILIVGFCINFYFPAWLIRLREKFTFRSIGFLTIVCISYTVALTLMLCTGILLGILMLRNGGYTLLSIFEAMFPFVAMASYFGSSVFGHYLRKHMANRIAKF